MKQPTSSKSAYSALLLSLTGELILVFMIVRDVFLQKEVQYIEYISLLVATLVGGFVGYTAYAVYKKERARLKAFLFTPIVGFILVLMLNTVALGILSLDYVVDYMSMGFLFAYAFAINLFSGFAGKFVHEGKALLTTMLPACTLYGFFAAVSEVPENFMSPISLVLITLGYQVYIKSITWYFLQKPISTHSTKGQELAIAHNGMKMAMWALAPIGLIILVGGFLDSFFV